MKKLYVLTGIFAMLFIYACSSDDMSESPVPEANKKKLIRMTFESDNDYYERYFYYNEEDKVFRTTRFYGNTTIVQDTYYEYENNLIVASKSYSDLQLTGAREFNYVNNNLIEIISYNKEGNQIHKLEFAHNLENRIRTIYTEVENSTTTDPFVNFAYNTDGNAIEMRIRRSFTQMEYDTNPKPGNNFTYANRFILNPQHHLYLNLSENNRLKSDEDPSSTHYSYITTTTITYDTDNYPVQKIFGKRLHENVVSIEKMTFQYE